MAQSCVKGSRDSLRQGPQYGEALLQRRAAPAVPDALLHGAAEDGRAAARDGHCVAGLQDAARRLPSASVSSPRERSVSVAPPAPSGRNASGSAPDRMRSKVKCWTLIGPPRRRAGRRSSFAASLLILEAAAESLALTASRPLAVASPTASAARAASLASVCSRS
jgi:hypothetical protein